MDRTRRRSFSRLRRPGAAILAIAALVGISSVVAACGGGGSAAASTATPAKSGVAGAQKTLVNQSTFVVASDNVGVSLDPAVASDQPALQAVTPLYETLVTYDPDKKKLEPTLATSWKVSPDGKTITLKLRKGVKFHDGSTLDAAAVAASLKRTVAIGKGESFLISSLKQATAVNPSTVKLTLKAPNSDFLYSLTHIFIASGKAMKAHAGSDNGQAWFAQHEAGSGPYTATSWQPNDHLTLKKFGPYWRGWAGKHITTFQFNEVQSADTELLQVEQGKADFANAVSIDNAIKQRSNKKVQVKIFPGSPFYVMFNAARPPLDNVNVRKALSLAIPYDQTIKQIMYGTATGLNGPVPGWMQGADGSLPLPKTNIAQAKDLLSKAGYGPSHPLQLRLAFYPGWTFEQTIATAYQYELNQLGVKLKIDALPWATFSEQVSKPSTRPDIGTIAVYVPIPSPGPTLTYSFDPVSEGNWAYWGYKNPKVTSLIHKAEATANTQQRVKLYQQAEDILVKDYAAGWLMMMPDTFVLSPSVHGLKHDPALGQVVNCYGVWKS